MLFSTFFLLKLVANSLKSLTSKFSFNCPGAKLLTQPWIEFNLIFASDGNTKDSIRVNRNMVYNYETMNPVPDLNTFRTELVTELLMSVFFQHRSEREIDMLRLPLIMAPEITGKMVNNEASKKTIMEKDFSYDKTTLEKFQALIDNREVNIKSVGDLGSKQLKQISDKLGISHPDKSAEVLRTDIVNLSKIILGKYSI
jgi:hypothetical protein